MGRWLLMLGAGGIGVVYFTVGLVPLVNGSVELKATEVGIAEIEQHGFPEDANYLHVTGGAVVWPRAHVDRRDGRITRIVAPVASPELAAAWTDGPIGVRLAVQFKGDQIAARWPGMEKLGTLEGLPAVAMDLTGETVPFRHHVGTLPSLSADDEKVMRAMYFERHSLASSVRKLLFGCVLLTLCAATIAWFRRRPPPAASSGPETEVLTAAGVEMLEEDVEVD